MDIIQVITQELKVEKWQVEAAVKLIDEGNTIPFISRYRKEATGSLNDEQLRALFERLTYLRNLEDKKNQVLKSIEDQGKLTEELKKQILDAQTLVVVEDLYRPYRPKRRTRATIAKCIPTSEMSYATNSRNVDTLSIECCHPDETGKFNEATYDSAVKLSAWLCVRFGLTSENVIRHYDVTGKNCPKYYVENPDAWIQMKSDIAAQIDVDYGLQDVQ